MKTYTMMEKLNKKWSKYKMEDEGEEIYNISFEGHAISISQGAFTGWVWLIHFDDARLHRKKIQAETRDEVKAQIGWAIGKRLPDDL